jgi:phosphomannomutase/phosphoglucomutase
MVIDFKEILKSCDIRGVYPTPLGEHQAERLGQAIGFFLKSQKHLSIRVVVGHDIRASSANLSNALILGLKKSGLKIFDMGLVSTPMLAFGSRFLNTPVGIMVTASHNPPEYNGFKFFNYGDPSSPDWISKIYQIFKTEQACKGAGIVENQELLLTYRNVLLRELGKSFSGFKVVVDVGNGMAAMTVPPVLQSLGCSVTIMNGQMDPSFASRGPDSSSFLALKKLGEQVVEHQAQLGLAFDGDADRVSFVDDQGRIFPNDYILCLFAENFLKNNKNAKVVYDSKCSEWVAEIVRREGGKPILERSGHSFIFSRMQAEKAFMGGEVSGHFFLPGGFPGDALYAALKLMEILKSQNKSLGFFYDIYPRRYSTQDVKVEMNENLFNEISDQFKKVAMELSAKISTQDGIRVVLEDSWCLVRQSVTEPKIIFRFESTSREALVKTIHVFLNQHSMLENHVLEAIES